MLRGTKSLSKVFLGQRVCLRAWQSLLKKWVITLSYSTSTIGLLLI
jgi:hypothetical protein